MSKMPLRFRPVFYSLFALILISLGVGYSSRSKKLRLDLISKVREIASEKRSPPKEDSDIHLGRPKTEHSADTQVAPLKSDGDKEENDEEEDEGIQPTSFQGLPGCKKEEYLSRKSSSNEVSTSVSSSEWKKTLDQFHLAKRKLQKWIQGQSAYLSVSDLVLLTKQVQEARLLAPSLNRDSDLRLRGMGFWERNDQGEISLFLSSGFVNLLVRQPERGLFEMTRLLAQALAPCELQRLGVKASWRGLLSCLNIKNEMMCDRDQALEGGWAVSTSLATRVALPKCIPSVFLDAKQASCLKDLKISSIDMPQMEAGAKK